MNIASFQPYQGRTNEKCFICDKPLKKGVVAHSGDGLLHPMHRKCVTKYSDSPACRINFNAIVAREEAPQKGIRRRETPQYRSLDPEIIILMGIFSDTVQNLMINWLLNSQKTPFPLGKDIIVSATQSTAFSISLLVVLLMERKGKINLDHSLDAKVIKSYSLALTLASSYLSVSSLNTIFQGGTSDSWIGAAARVASIGFGFFTSVRNGISLSRSFYEYYFK